LWTCGGCPPLPGRASSRSYRDGPASVPERRLTGGRQPGQEPRVEQVPLALYLLDQVSEPHPKRSMPRIPDHSPRLSSYSRETISPSNRQLGRNPVRTCPRTLPGRSRVICIGTRELLAVSDCPRSTGAGGPALWSEFERYLLSQAWDTPQRWFGGRPRGYTTQWDRLLRQGGTSGRFPLVF
jgi:hypothetical protein